MQNVEMSGLRPVGSTLCIPWMQNVDTNVDDAASSTFYSAKNVDRSAAGPDLSTFVVLFAMNVDAGRPRTGRATFFAHPRQSRSGLPFNAAVLTRRAL